MEYDSVRTRIQETICYMQIIRPEANNAINDVLINELQEILSLCRENVTIVVLEGLDDVFCIGADFQGMYEKMVSGKRNEQNQEPLYDLWLKMATGPYITVSEVRLLQEE